MLDNQTRRELLSKARQTGFPGSILDVFAAYEQGKDLIGEFQQQQQQQQVQQMSDMSAEQAGMIPPGQQPLPQEMPQMPAGPPPGLQGQSLPNPPPPANPNLVDSTQQQPVGMATDAKGSSSGQVLMATGGFVEKFTEDQYNKFSTHFPFSKEQRGSIAHNATVEHPDLTMVRPKKYVFGGLKYALGGKETDPPSYTLPTLEVKATRSNPTPKMLEPGFQDELAYSEAKHKLMLRQQLEGAQNRFMGGENILDAIKDHNLAGQAFSEMISRYPNDKRLTSKEITRGQAAGSFLLQKAVERYLGKRLPGVSNNQNYQYFLKGVKRGNNMVGPIFDIKQFQDAEREAQNQYNNYTEELKDKVDTYEKAHGTYQPGLFERLNDQIKMRKTHFKFAEGGFEGDPLKKVDVATAADSAFVADRANQVHNFYIRNGYSVEDKVEVSPSLFNDLRLERENIKQRLSRPESRDQNNYNSHPIDTNTRRAISYNDYTTYKEGQHKFGQREMATGVINMQAPMSYYDDRIMPQYAIYYLKGDYANVPTYDKLAVTPWGKLTEDQKLKRLQKFGSSGTPFEGQTAEEAIQSFNTPRPVMKDIKPFAVPQIDIKPQLTNLPLPQTTKERVTINTDQGDKVRVQDIKTKRFLGWEDPSGETLDLEKPTGDWKVDFAATHPEAVAKKRLEMRRENEAKQNFKFATGGKKLLKKRR